jgi:hypothetical protein
MTKQLVTAGDRTLQEAISFPAAFVATIAAMFAFTPFAGPAQNTIQANPQTETQNVDAPTPQRAGQALTPKPAPSPVKERFLTDKFPERPSLAPSWSIPLEPLGFSSPGAIYLGERVSFASLDFIDEDHLLFTFRVPGLLHRDTQANEQSDERQIRAVVLALPKGAVEADAQWTLHDRIRYLWMLKNGHFLLRDRNNLLEGDAALKLRPQLDFPGFLLSINLDPAQHLLVTNSREPVMKPAKAGQVPSPSSASAAITSDDESEGTDNSTPDLVVRVLNRDSGDVLLVSRVRAEVHLPINSQGYVENLRGQAAEWVLDLGYFTGGTKMLGSVESACVPRDDFLSETEILAAGCASGGEIKLVAISTAGQTLWETQAPSTMIWPQMAVSANGLRLAWETIDTDHAISAFAPIGSDDIKEQSVTVFDAANGDIAMVSPVSPILDAGGNVALSPSGQRVALVNNGAIQVFELPAPHPLPAANGRLLTH